jgi:hypothetical protein
MKIERAGCKEYVEGFSSHKGIFPVTEFYLSCLTYHTDDVWEGGSNLRVERAHFMVGAGKDVYQQLFNCFYTDTHTHTQY